MANHKSAIKRARQDQRRTVRNKSRKSTIKTHIKKVEAAVASNSPEEARHQFQAAQKIIDKSAARKTIHKNTAARKVSRLTRLVNSLE